MNTPYSPGAEAPIPTNGPAGNAAPAGDLATQQMAAINELTRRMGGMGNDQYDQRIRLGEAVHNEISAGGSGWSALGGSPDMLVAEAQIRQIEADRGDAKPAGATSPSEYTALRPEVFGDHEEATAFGTVLSNAGLDARMVAGVVAGVAGDARIAAAIRGGEQAIEARLVEVREFFDRQPEGRQDLKLAVAFGQHLVSKDQRLGSAFEATLMSEDALFTLACEAKRLNFQPTRR